VYILKDFEVQDNVLKLSSRYPLRIGIISDEHFGESPGLMGSSFEDSEGRISDYAWYPSNSEGKTREVGEKRPNRFGLYDMHGNAWQFGRHDLRCWLSCLSA